MIEIHFDERVKIGLQYALETLHGCSPFGQERIRRLRFYAPEERAELERELYNVEQAARAAEALKDTYTKVMTVLCQMKRHPHRPCAAARQGRPRIMWSCSRSRATSSGWRTSARCLTRSTALPVSMGCPSHDPKPALAVLDPDKTGSRGFYIPRQRHGAAQGDTPGQEGCGGAAVPRPDRRGEG